VEGGSEQEVEEEGDAADEGKEKQGKMAVRGVWVQNSRGP